MKMKRKQNERSRSTYGMKLMKKKVVDNQIKLGVSNSLGIPSDTHRFFIETRKEIVKGKKKAKKEKCINWNEVKENGENEREKKYWLMIR